jgi:quinone-modifying oxidoreductase subunit QmoB
MTKKVGIYICTGCGIGDVLKVEDMVAVVEEEGTTCKTHECLCSDAGVDFLKAEVAEGTNFLGIAACSRRVNFDIFKFENTMVDRINLREGVVWSHSREKYPIPTQEQIDSEDDSFDEIQMLAEDYLRMGMVKLEKIEIPEGYKTESLSKKILVLGGGITGISSALDAAAAGYDVTIVEKEDALGGYAAKLRKQMPVVEPFDTLVNPVIDEKIKAVEEASNITVKTATIVARIAGQPGEFTVTFKKPGEKVPFDCPLPVPEEQKVDADGKELDVEAVLEVYNQINDGREDLLTLDPDGELFGAVILAAGWRPADLSGDEYSHLGVGDADVISNAQFEEIAAKGKITRPSDGKEAKNVVFVQSPGKGDDDSDFSYAGSVTSMVSLKQAKYVREDYEDGKAYVFYQHMRTPGLQEYFYKGIQQDNGIFLSKGDVVGVTKNGSEFTVDAENTLLGDKIQVKADLVVLAGGMVPATADDAVLNLAYRQGPGFRDNDIYDGYADSNFICFPYETQRTGIYAAGCVRRSMTMEESIEDATGAALKAIQCIESVDRGVAVHPRSGDMTYPDFFFQRCTQCKRCTEECPFGALDDDEKGTPKPNHTRCRRCGSCMGACPERIIGFADYSIDSIGSMIKNIWVPSEDDYYEPPMRIVCLVCENDAYPALDIAAMNRLEFSADVRFIPVRCLGSVNVIWIKDALSKGIDGVFLLGCNHGDDYQCHFVKGSELADVRMKKMGETLQSLALEPERVGQYQVAIDEYDKLPEIVNTFADTITELGPNPFKGF